MVGDSRGWTRRGFVGATAATAAASGLWIPGRARATLGQPNIVFVMADDLGRELLGCYGGSGVDTPNIDAFAAGALRFESAYATPVCTPTRAIIQTGAYPFRSGFTDMIEVGESLNPGWAQLGPTLQAAGYTTCVTGKWQLASIDESVSHPIDCGYDSVNVWAWTDQGLWVPRYWDPVTWDGATLSGPHTGLYGPDLFLQHAKDFITANAANPFFLYYPMVLPHTPCLPPPGSGLDPTLDDWAHHPLMVAYLDQLFGDLVAHIDSLGLLNNTLIIFTADNGTAQEISTVVQSGLTVDGGKQTLKETGVTVPFLASYPDGGMPPGVVPELIDFTDLLPTFAELAGAAPPAGDGNSFAGLLDNSITTYVRRHWVFTQFRSEILSLDWAIREPRWKMRRNHELFDLDNDPFELAPTLPGGDTADGEAARARFKLVADNLLANFPEHQLLPF